MSQEGDKIESDLLSLIDDFSRELDNIIVGEVVGHTPPRIVRHGSSSSKTSASTVVSSNGNEASSLGQDQDHAQGSSISTKLPSASKEALSMSAEDDDDFNEVDTTASTRKLSNLLSNTSIPPLAPIKISPVDTSLSSSPSNASPLHPPNITATTTTTTNTTTSTSADTSSLNSSSNLLPSSCTSTSLQDNLVTVTTDDNFVTEPLSLPSSPVAKSKPPSNAESSLSEDGKDSSSIIGENEDKEGRNSEEDSKITDETTTTSSPLPSNWKWLNQAATIGLGIATVAVDTLASGAGVANSISLTKSDATANITKKLNPADSSLVYQKLLMESGSIEMSISAGCIEKVPFFIPKGRTVTWKFKVKDFDINFGVNIRVQADAGGAMEQEVEVGRRISCSDNLVFGSRKSADIDRHLVFVFDNSFSRVRSKTCCYRVVQGDSAVSEIEDYNKTLEREEKEREMEMEREREREREREKEREKEERERQNSTESRGDIQAKGDTDSMVTDAGIPTTPSQKLTKILGGVISNAQEKASAVVQNVHSATKLALAEENVNAVKSKVIDMFRDIALNSVYDSPDDDDDDDNNNDDNDEGDGKEDKKEYGDFQEGEEGEGEGGEEGSDDRTAERRGGRRGVYEGRTSAEYDNEIDGGNHAYSSHGSGISSPDGSHTRRKLYPSPTPHSTPPPLHHNQYHSQDNRIGSSTKSFWPLQQSSSSSSSSSHVTDESSDDMMFNPFNGDHSALPRSPTNATTTISPQQFHTTRRGGQIDRDRDRDMGGDLGLSNTFSYHRSSGNNNNINNNSNNNSPSPNTYNNDSVFLSGEGNGYSMSPRDEESFEGEEDGFLQSPISRYTNNSKINYPN